MDLSPTIVADSTQIGADDLLSGPITVTITKTVVKKTKDQPVDVSLAEINGKVYRPSKSMRRVMVAAWGKESEAYTGRRMTLYRNPDIRWGGEKVGGIEIGAMSHIARPLTIALTRSKGIKEAFTVQPLPDAPEPQQQPTQRGPEPTADQVDQCTDIDTLKRMWSASGPERRAQIEARVEELRAFDAQQPQAPDPELDPEPAAEPADASGLWEDAQ